MLASFVHIGRNRVVSGSSDGTVYEWDCSTGLALRKFCLDFKALKALDLNLLGEPIYPSMPECLVFDPLGQVVLMGSRDKMARAWDLMSGGLVHELGPHDGPIEAVAYSPDHQLLATTGLGERSVRIWDAETGQPRHTLVSGVSDPSCVAFSNLNNIIAAGTDHGVVYVWDTRTGTLLKQLPAREERVSALAVWLNGRSLLGGFADGTVRVWNLVNGQALADYSVHDCPVLSLAFAPDGQHFATAAADNTARVWRLFPGHEVRCFQGHHATVNSVSFAPWSVGVLLTGSSDRTVRLWATGLSDIKVGQ
jgi:WD40 repeat protein